MQIPLCIYTKFCFSIHPLTSTWGKYFIRVKAKLIWRTTAGTLPENTKLERKFAQGDQGWKWGQTRAEAGR